MCKKIETNENFFSLGEILVREISPELLKQESETGDILGCNATGEKILTTTGYGNLNVRSSNLSGREPLIDFARNQIYQRIRRGDSIVIIDPERRLHTREMWIYLTIHGYCVDSYDLDCMDGSCCFNCLSGLEPYKYNHRYPNKDYVTISKKMGRRVSRIGYPVFVDLNEEYFFILEIEVGIKDYKTVKLDFPVIVKLTEEKPVCNLGFRFNFDAATFQFESYYEHENDGIIGHRHTIWTNKEDHNIENAIVITPLIQVNPKNGVYVAEVLTPHPQTFEHFMC